MREIYFQLTRRKTTPSDLTELWIIAGRRGGKTRIASLIASYLAFFADWQSYLAAGEKGHILLISPDRRQSRVSLGYIDAMIARVPMLQKLVERRTKEEIILTNGIVISIQTASFRTVRGYSVVASICDEIAFWRSEDSANPDTEILTALRPAMSTVPGSLLIAISSPYSRRGELFRAYGK